MIYLSNWYKEETNISEELGDTVEDKSEWSSISPTNTFYGCSYELFKTDFQGFSRVISLLIFIYIVSQTSPSKLFCSYSGLIDSASILHLHIKWLFVNFH